MTNSKNNLKRIFAIALLLVAVCAVVLTTPFEIAQASAKKEIYDYLTDEIIAIYEQEIAKKPVVSNMNDKALLSLGEKHQISVQKTKTILLICDLCNRTDDCVKIGDLAKMKDGELIKVAKRAVDKYGEGLSKEQKDALKGKFLSALKSK